MGRFGGKGDNDRALTTKEMELIRRVFASAPLPSLLIISIGDGVNAQGGAWTDSDYQINVGPMLYNSDLTVTAPATLVHEMTHVGQYHQGTLTKAHAFFAHVLHGFARRSEYLYDYTLGDSWDDFGFEGQAQMVEDWYDNDKMSTVGHRFVYIEKVLRTGNPLTRSLTLEELRQWPGLIDVKLVDMTQPDLPGSSAPLSSPLEQLLMKRFPEGDPAALSRVHKLEEYFQNTAHPKQLLARLEGRRSDDRVARYFYQHLHPATTARLLKILKDRP